VFLRDKNGATIRNTFQKPTEEDGVVMPKTALSRTAYIGLATLAIASASCKSRDGSVVKVANGLEAGAEEYPYVIRGDVAGGCTSTIISPNVVLTASHCVMDESDMNSPDFIENGLKKRDILSTYKYFAPSGEIQPRAIYAHPGADGQGNGWDLAVAIFAKGAFQGESAKISKTPAKENDLITMVGFGDNNNIKETGGGDTKRKGTNTISDVTIKGMFRIVGAAKNAPGTKGTGEATSVGSGDSGGPAFAGDTADLVGVASWKLVEGNQTENGYVDIHNRASKLFFLYLTRLGIDIPLPPNYLTPVRNIPIGEYVDKSDPQCKAYVSNVQRTRYSAGLPQDRHFFVFKGCGQDYYKADLTCSATQCKAECGEQCDNPMPTINALKYKAFSASGENLGKRRFSFVEDAELKNLL
jgi:hypothetical protein